MLKRFIVVYVLLMAALFAAWLCFAQQDLARATMPMTGAGSTDAAAGYTGSCTLSTNLQNRMDGSQNQTAVDTAICNLVSDFGLSSTTTTLPPIDALWMFATNSTTNANLNWLGSSYTLTQFGTVTFSAAGGGTGGYYTVTSDAANFGSMQTGYNPSTAGGNYALNSASWGVCVFTSRTTTSSDIELGGTDGASHYTYLQPVLSSGTTYYDINGADSTANILVGQAQGNWIYSRSAASTVTGYVNNVAHNPNNTNTSNAIPNVSFDVVGYNSNGSHYGTLDHIGYAMFGGALSSGQASAVYTRLHNYFSTVGAPTGC
jgi:hypothetical protein